MAISDKETLTSPGEKIKSLRTTTPCRGQEKLAAGQIYIVSAGQFSG